MVTLSLRNFTVKDKSLGRCNERSGYEGLEKFSKLENLHYEGMIPDLHYYAEDISEEAEFQAATHCYMCEEDGTKWNPDGTKTIAVEPVHGWGGQFKKVMAQLRRSLIGGMKEDNILRSQLSFKSAFII